MMAQKILDAVDKNDLKALREMGFYHCAYRHSLAGLPHTNIDLQGNASDVKQHIDFAIPGKKILSSNCDKLFRDYVLRSGLDQTVTVTTVEPAPEFDICPQCGGDTINGKCTAQCNREERV